MTFLNNTKYQAKLNDDSLVSLRLKNYAIAAVGLTEQSATVLTSIKKAENIFMCNFANSYLNDHLHLQIK